MIWVIGNRREFNLTLRGKVSKDWEEYYFIWCNSDCDLLEFSSLLDKFSHLAWDKTKYNDIYNHAVKHVIWYNEIEVDPIELEKEVNEHVSHSDFILTLLWIKK